MLKRLHLKITGIVQGIGFRPFIYRIATQLNLFGWVNNTSAGVFIELEGEEETLKLFLAKLNQEKPTLSEIYTLEIKELTPVGYTNFTINHSTKGETTAVILPEIATCKDCLQEVFNPLNRRFRYPFTNCTNCGPRYTIMESLPYDRQNTTMKGFIMCADCQKEYDDPLNRRFHAQPNGCKICGPHLELWNDQGEVLAKDDQALLDTATAIKKGKILAIKGLGGFHLVVDGRNEKAVKLLRQRKNRPDKPFALMYPSLELIENHCEISNFERELLTSFQAPIVLLKAKHNINLAPNIIFNNPYLGIMLPYTPLHHLLMKELNFPIVATSGNLRDESICIEEKEALERLQGIGDLFLIHNRPIIRPVDDSIVREILGRKMILRRARGYAPLPISVNLPTHNQGQNYNNYLALGGHLKNTIAINIKEQIFISQHIGDIANAQAFNTFQKAIASLTNLYGIKPKEIICDLHPDYISSEYAMELSKNPIKIQHHYAHILACLADNNILTENVLGVAWDGTGYGADSTIWGGEFLQINLQQTKDLNPKHLEDFPYQRVAYFDPFPLVGGNKAIKETRRSALGLLYKMFGESIFKTDNPYYFLINNLFTQQELLILSKMLTQNLNTPLTSSVGRLFDGVSALLNLYPKVTFEGQGAMDLEFRLDSTITDNYNFNLNFLPNDKESKLIIQWQPIIQEILKDMENDQPLGLISAKFHNTLTEIIIKIAHIMEINIIVLTGGCFQNKYLLEKTILKLKNAKFTPHWHQNIPPNDGGIAIGQIISQLINVI
jgi:hydrogenase maturation protein HypF